MNTITDIKEKLTKLSKAEKMNIIFGLLVDKSIDYKDISLAYVCYLKEQKEKDQTEKMLLAMCLATKYQDVEDTEYIDARSSILLHPYVPDKLIEDIFGHISKKEIKKQLKFLKDQGVV